MLPMTYRFTLELRRIERDSHDACSECQRPFHEGETTHCGYSDAGSAMFVGDCCADRLVETAARYLWQRRSFVCPPSHASLWRYIDFSKFVALLKDSALYFARADMLGDRFEGAHGTIGNKRKWDHFYLEFFSDAIRNPPPGQTCDLTTEQIQAEAKTLLRQFARGSRAEIKNTFVSCWHESDVESEALWRLYCGTFPGVAIRTDTKRLISATGDDPAIRIGRVEYIDFRQTFAGPNDAIFRKRKSLSHEREVRAVINKYRHQSGGRPGIQIRTDLPELIASVVVSPFAPDFFHAVVLEVLSRFSVDVSVEKSELADKPFF